EVADALERGEIEQVVQAYFEPYHTLKQYIFSIVTTSGDEQLIYWWAYEGHKLNRKNCKKVIKDIRQNKFKARVNEVYPIEEIGKKDYKVYNVPAVGLKEPDFSDDEEEIEDTNNNNNTEVDSDEDNEAETKDNNNNDIIESDEEEDDFGFNNTSSTNTNIPIIGIDPVESGDYKFSATSQLPIEQKEQTAIVIQEPIETLPIETPTTQPAPEKTNKNLKLQTPLIPQKKSTFRPSTIITSTQPSLSNPVKNPQIEFTNNQTTQTFG